jgi:hypothetical protein
LDFERLHPVYVVFYAFIEELSLSHPAFVNPTLTLSLSLKGGGIVDKDNSMGGDL